MDDDDKAFVGCLQCLGVILTFFIFGSLALFRYLFCWPTLRDETWFGRFCGDVLHAQIQRVADRSGGSFWNPQDHWYRKGYTDEEMEMMDPEERRHRFGRQ